jgi:hypothetical protein
VEQNDCASLSALLAQAASSAGAAAATDGKFNLDTEDEAAVSAAALLTRLSRSCVACRTVTRCSLGPPFAALPMVFIAHRCAISDTAAFPLICSAVRLLVKAGADVNHRSVSSAFEIQSA